MGMITDRDKVVYLAPGEAFYVTPEDIGMMIYVRAPRASNPAPLPDPGLILTPTAPAPAPAPAPARRAPRKSTTRKKVLNKDLAILERWGLNDPDIHGAMTTDDWRALARSLGRTLDASRALGQRYLIGVFEEGPGGPEGRVIVHPEKDPSRREYLRTRNAD